MRPPPVATADLLVDPVAAPTGSARAYPKWLALGIAIGGLASQGCSVECKGPGCESAYPQGRIDVVGGLPLDGRSFNIDVVTTGSIVGSVVSGSDFHVAVYEGELYVGQPEARSVRRFANPSGDVTDDDYIDLWQSDVDGFGAGVATITAGSSLVMVVAAPEADRGRGEVHLFFDAANGTDIADVVLSSPSQGDKLGDTIHTCPDQTGDGIAELVISSPWFQTPTGSDVDIPALAGAVFWVPSELLLQSTGRVPITDVATFWWGDSIGDAAGTDVDCAHDLDGDGIPDLAIGAPQANNHAGALFLLSGANLPPSGPLSEAAYAQVDGEPDANVGSSVASTYRDGVPHLLIGAAGLEAGRGGAVLVNATTLVTEARFESAETSPDHLGRSVAAADLDGDGIDELLIGGPDKREGQLFDIGQVLVFDGSVARSSTISSDDAEQQITDDQGFRRVGQHILPIDLDGDGQHELLLPTRSRRTQ